MERERPCVHSPEAGSPDGGTLTWQKSEKWHSTISTLVLLFCTMLLGRGITEDKEGGKEGRLTHSNNTMHISKLLGLTKTHQNIHNIF
jgi:hypothetical protein